MRRKIYIHAVLLLIILFGKQAVAQQMTETGWPMHFKQAMHYTWSGGSWVNDMRMTPYMDSSGRMMYILGEMHMGMGGWAMSTKMTMSYDTHGMPHMGGQHRYMNNNWADYTSDTFRCDSFGRVDTSFHYQLNNGQWHCINRGHYMYDSLGRLQGILQENVSGGGQWEHDEYYYYFYDTQNRLMEIQDKDWDGNQWVPKIKQHISFNTAGAVSEVLSQDTSSTGWVNAEKYVFDSAYNVTGIARRETPALQMSVYPNPVGRRLQVKLPGTEGPVQLYVYNIEGQLLIIQEQIASSPNITLDVSDLPAGSYILQCYTGQGQAAVSFIKN